MTLSEVFEIALSLRGSSVCVIPMCGGHSCIEVAVENLPVAQYH